MKLSTRDVILITLTLLIGGPGAARTVLKLANRYIGEKLGPYFETDIEEETFRVVLSRLKKSGLVARGKGGIWKATATGKMFAKLKLRRMNYEEFKKLRKKIDTIIIFDIPEDQRKKRGYLRIELRELDFKPLQKSVWLGSGPLPVSFIEYLKDIRLLRHVHIFTIKEFGTIDDYHRFLIK